MPTGSRRCCSEPAGPLRGTRPTLRIAPVQAGFREADPASAYFSA